MFGRRLIWWKKQRPKTAIHPEYKRLIEKVATVDGKDLFAFKNLLDMPTRRHDKCMRFTLEYNLKLDLDTLRTTHEEVINDVQLMDPNNLASFKRKITALLENMQRITELAISCEASYRLASCVYFWIDEDLTDYDFEVGDQKIEMFKKMRLDDFFLNEPMNKFLPQMNLSARDLEVFWMMEKERRKIHSGILTKAKSKKVTR